MLRRFVLLSIFGTLLLNASVVFAASGGDHPLFRRPPGYSIVERSVAEGSLSVPGERGDLFLSGSRTDIFYHTRSNRPLSSKELGLRFLSALHRAGGTVVFSESPGLGGLRSVGKIVREGRDVWVVQEVTSNRDYTLSVLETPNRRANLSSPSFSRAASELEAEVLDLLWEVERTGRLEFPVAFASGGTVPKKGSEQNFEKLALLMEKDSTLKFTVLTYTDPNLQPLNQRTQLRARIGAIIGSLSSQGADPKRLAMAGGDDAVPSGIVRFVSVKSFEE